MKSAFPHLPEQSRLFRLWRKYQHLAKRFLAKPTILGACDTFGIELLHPRHEGRCEWHMARKGKSNGRWIVGAKWFVLINSQGQIVRIGCCSANCHDTHFQCVIETFEKDMVVLADKGFHAQEGDPANLKICERGQWNERMLIETLFSACEGVFQMKKMECLNQNWFESLEEAQNVLEAWRTQYNEERPHRALDGQTPAVHLANW